LCFLINLFFFLDLIKYWYVSYHFKVLCITGKDQDNLFVISFVSDI
jgi:hypothetical protein